MDPLGEKYSSLSPYNFVGNNPIGFIDIKGDSITPIGYGQHLQIGVINWDKGIRAGEFTLYGGTGVNSSGDEVQMWVASKNYTDGTREDLFVLDPESVGEFRRNSSYYSGWTPPEKRVSLIEWYFGGAHGSVWDAYASTWTPENVAFGIAAFGGSIKVAKPSTTVFRAVDATESVLIKNTGRFSLQQGGVEVKYFAKSLDDAHWYGQRLYPKWLFSHKRYCTRPG